MLPYKALRTHGLYLPAHRLLEDLTWVDLRGGLSTEGLDRLEWGITGRKPGGAGGAAIAAGEDPGERVHPADGSVLVPVPAGSYPIGAGDLAAASGPRLDRGRRPPPNGGLPRRPHARMTLDPQPLTIGSLDGRTESDLRLERSNRIGGDAVEVLAAAVPGD